MKTLPFVAALCVLCAADLRGMKPSAHYKLAYQAATDPRIGFSEMAAKIIAVGAAAPDKSDWETAAAHAQTPNDGNGNPTMTRDAAVAAFDRYVQVKSAQIDSALASGDVSGALYRIGYLMHAFQDLAAHMGITNYTHSHLDARGRSPDTDPDRIARAEAWSSDLLQQASGRWSTSWEELRNYHGTGPNDFDQFSTAISSGEADRTWRSVGSYVFSRFSNNDPPSGGWGDISAIEEIRLAALTGVYNPSAAERKHFERNQEQVRRDTLRSGAKEQQRQVLVNVMNRAQAAEEQCLKRFVACCDKCPGWPPDASVACIAACGNCDAEGAAHWKAIQAVADFDARPVSRQQR